VTAGAFSFGFLVSAFLGPLLGRLMDRRGPRWVMVLGVVLVGAGLGLAPLTREPWHLYASLGVLVGGGGVPGCGALCWAMAAPAVMTTAAISTTPITRFMKSSHTESFAAEGNAA
jgi:MFS family permease